MRDHDPDDLARTNAMTTANPHVRSAANLAGVDLRTVQGTGPTGRITLDDVHRATSRQE